MRQRDEEALAARIAAAFEPEPGGDLRDARARRLHRRQRSPVLVELRIALAREGQQAERLVEERVLNTHGLVEGPPERIEQRVERVTTLRRHRERRAGNRITSRIASLPASTIVSRSIPIPQPPVGGMPYESASTKSGSPGSASSAPASRSASCIAKRWACSSASFSSLNALANSIPPTTASKRSTSVSSSSVVRANGDSSIGQSWTNVGWISSGSTKCE